ncbi:MAG TPA: hypothetical protein VD789_03095 [Thermomicrobiales bacterium]|nr:hypothetical protein [Thermomicrobiales bacterium]
MTDRSVPGQQSNESPVQTWQQTIAWALVFLALIAYAVYRLELFPLSSKIATENGSTSLPRAFFTVDHPFHTSRADLIHSAWASFDTVRWVANHQGGYPAEFFPLGLPALGALITSVSAGTVAIESAWTIAIVVVFILPGLAWFLIGREDRLSPGVAAIALTGQIAIASDWMHGGFTELVEWGLATNVAGATYALLAIPLLVRAVERRSVRVAGAAAMVIALCAASNPRSLIAVSIIALAMIVHAAVTGKWRDGVSIAGGIALLSAGLAAPVIIPLLRYSDLYFFLSYQEYADVGAYWRETVDAVTWPVLLLAGVGIVLAYVNRTHRATQVASLALVLYMLVTTAASASPSVRELIPQLELPRLMPFQRFLTIYLASYAVVDIGRRALPFGRRLPLGRDVTLAGVVSVALVLVFATDVGPFARAEQGLRDVPRTEASDGAELLQFREAISIADDAAPADTAILVIGSRLSWHEQLWAPMVAEDRRFYYDNWLWYWHKRHDGPYNYQVGHHYPNPSEALTDDYLDTHGVGAVVITDIADQGTGANARDVARSAGLEPIGTIGGWDVFGVTEPESIGTINGQPADDVEISEDRESITLVFEASEQGTLVVRQNWFPRWSAEVNGEPVDLERAENGYIEIETPGGHVEVELTYTVTSADVVARVAATTSALIVAVLIIVPAPTGRSARRLWSASRGSTPR